MHIIIRQIIFSLCALTACLMLPACVRGIAADAPLASQAAANATAPIASPRPATPALWKVADEDTTIYLFGTIHVLPKGIDWFGGKVADAYARSDELVTEIADDDPAMMQTLIAQTAMLPSGQSLRAMLDPDQRTAYEAALAGLGVPPTLFDRFEPWYAAIGLSTLPLIQEGFATENGVEKALEVKAAQRALPHEGLETAAYQLGLFDTLPVPVQQRYLAEIIAQLPNFKAEIGKMVEAWKMGDADRLAELMNAEESDPVLVETLLINRNRAWAGWIEKRLEKPGTVFVAVGAGHLAGDGSVQDQLAKADIPSERVR